jgi:putative ATP-binding cassette transporter
MKFFKSLSKIFSFLLQCSKSIRFSSLAVVVVLLTGIIAGLGNAALVAIINSKLSVGMAWERTLFWSFAALCLLLPTARFVSGFLLTYISTLAVANLRLRLCRQILDTPLRRLEELGTHRLLGVLTDDIPAITNALGVALVEVAPLSDRLYQSWNSCL